MTDLLLAALGFVLAGAGVGLALAVVLVAFSLFSRRMD